MNRRDFIKTGLFVSSSLILPIKNDIFRIEKCTSVSEWHKNPSYKISKGKHFTTLNGNLKDLRDCHGLCATHEMAVILMQNLELGERIIEIYNLPFDMPDLERRKIIEKTKRCHITKNEFKQIFLLCYKLRGKHDCVLNKSS